MRCLMICLTLNSFCELNFFPKSFSLGYFILMFHLYINRTRRDHLSLDIRYQIQKKKHCVIQRMTSLYRLTKSIVSDSKSETLFSLKFESVCLLFLTHWTWKRWIVTKPKGFFVFALNEFMNKQLRHLTVNKINSLKNIYLRCFLYRYQSHNVHYNWSSNSSEEKNIYLFAVRYSKIMILLLAFIFSILVDSGVFSVQFINIWA